MDSAGRSHEKTSLHDQNPSGSAQDEHSNDVLQDERQLTENPEDYDWEQLQEKYTDIMEKHAKTEEELRAQTSKLFEIFMVWSQTTVVRDETRALKRFKTQMGHVQNSEERLEKKRKHYGDVVKAFESALALLNDRMKP